MQVKPNCRSSSLWSVAVGTERWIGDRIVVRWLPVGLNRPEFPDAFHNPRRRFGRYHGNCARCSGAFRGQVPDGPVAHGESCGWFTTGDGCK